MYFVVKYLEYLIKFDIKTYTKKMTQRVKKVKDDYIFTL